MLRKIGFSLLCAAASLSTSAYSTEYTVQSGVSLDYVFDPKQDPVVLSNYMYWTIEANCKISIESNDKAIGNKLLAEALARKGKVNDVILTSGNSMEVTVQHGDNLKISADSGAKVRITNKGTQVVKATCTT